jgi:SAM-dependent methyltransferase
MAFPFGTRWSGRLYEYRRCNNCRSMLIDPLPSDGELRQMYGHAAYHSEHYANLDLDGGATLLPRMRGAMGPVRTLLDFGCGNGSFLRSMRELGIDAEGVELDAAARAAAAANSGCRVSSLEEVVAVNRTYDVVRLGDVLEHLRSPKRTLSELERLLAPGGVFFIEGPLEENPSLVLLASRIFGTMKKLLGRELFGDLPPFHLSRMSAAGLRQFLRKTMNYELREFTVYETGWPYLQDDRRVSAKHSIRRLIGRSAVGLADAGRFVGLEIGNRFATIAAVNRGKH